MKQICTILIAICIWSCQQTPDVQDTAKVVEPAILSGQIQNPKEDGISVRKGDDTYKATLKEGSFSVEIPVSEPGFYRFNHGAEYATLYLEPGTDLQLSLNTEQFDETLKFTGGAAAENNYLISKLLFEDQLIEDKTAFYSLDEEAFITAHDEKTQKLKSFYQDFLKANPEASKNFVDNEANDMLYSWASERLWYPEYHEYYAKKEDFKPSDSYYSFLDRLKMDDESLIKNTAYKKFITDYIQYKFEQAEPETAAMTEAQKLQAKFDIIDKEFKNEQVRNLAAYNQMRDLVRYEGSKVNDEMIASFDAISTDEEAKAEVSKLYKEWAHLTAGKEAPAFTYANLKGEKISLASLIGKNIYIDVWATWCGPCKRELPHLEELQTKYKGSDDLVFASVSIDKDKEAWEKMVQEKNMMGIQIIGDNAWESSICKDYNINGIPRFILIDKEGKLIDVDAPRPSSEEIKGILAELAKPEMTSMN